MEKSVTGGNTMRTMIMAAATFAAGLIVYKLVSKAVGTNSDISGLTSSGEVSIPPFISDTKEAYEETAAAGGTPIGGTCTNPNPEVCTQICEDLLGGTLGTDNRCYRNGVAVYEHPFTGGRTAQRKSKSFFGL